MAKRIIQAYRRLEGGVLTALALVWLGLLGDHDVPALAAESRPPGSAAHAQRVR